MFGRVGHGDGQRAALALEREDDVLRGDVAGDQLEDPGIDLEPREVHRRHAVLPGQHLGDLDFGDDARLDHHVAQAQATRLGFGGRRRELLASQQTFLQKEVADGIAAYRH